MGASSSSPWLQNQPPPEKLSDFKQLSAAPELYSIPEVPQKRRATDVAFLVILGVTLLVLFGFLAYSLSCSDHRRYTHGYDNSGDLCGFKNTEQDGVPDSGKDMRDLPYLKYSLNGRVCVKSCNDGDEFYEYNMTYTIQRNRCVPEGIFCCNDDAGAIELWTTYDNSFDQLIFIEFITFALCFGMLLLFRYATATVIWSIVLGCYCFLLAFTFHNAFMVEESTAETVTISVFLMCFVIVLTFLLIATIKRIPFVIKIFHESSKAVFSMPLITFQPLLTFLALFVSLLLYLLTTVSLKTAGVLTNITDDIYSYEPNATILFTYFLSTLLVIWMWKFIMGCQIMVVSGAVSSWYFAREKTFLGHPIRDSFSNLIKFHLGSVAFGSLVLTAVDVLKATLKALSSRRSTRCFVSCCMGWLQSVLVYLSTNAYIQIAMHGEGFYKSGKRALHLMCLNLLDVISLNSVGDFILFMAKVLVVCTTIVIALLIDDGEADNVILLAAITSIVMAHCFFSLFETAIDTIFLCYCEDCAINDGVEKHYYMSMDLMQIFDESRAILAIAPPNL